jgi:hypothetical protein
LAFLASAPSVAAPYTVLKRNAEEITRRAGRPIRITTVADKNSSSRAGHRR